MCESLKLAMKRKVVIEEYGQHAISRARSGWDHLVNFFSPPQEHFDFYPPSEKKHFFEDGKTFKTVAFSNGLLFGGCMKYGCVESCLPIRDFPPSDDRDARVFQSYVQVHHAAVSCGDLMMASEYRKLIEEYRSDICINCKVNNRPIGELACNGDPSDPQLQGHLLHAAPAPAPEAAAALEAAPDPREPTGGEPVALEGSESVAVGLPMAVASEANADVSPVKVEPADTGASVS